MTTLVTDLKTDDKAKVASPKEDDKKSFTMIELASYMDVCGMAPCKGPCWICKSSEGGLYELPEFSRAVFYICKDCNWQWENVWIVAAAVFGWLYMHNWHGEIVNIRRSSGEIHKARITAMQKSSKHGATFVCTWKGTTGEYSVPASPYCRDRSADYDMSRGCDYKMLMELNPQLPALAVVPNFKNIPIPTRIVAVCEALVAKLNGANIPDDKLVILPN